MIYVLGIFIGVALAAAFGKGCFAIGRTLGKVDAAIELDKENFVLCGGHREPDIYLPPRMQSDVIVHRDSDRGVYSSPISGTNRNGNWAEGATSTELAHLRRTRRFEGICPNGCAVMILADAYHRHCPKCGFNERAHLPFSIITVSDAWEELKDCKL